MRPSVHLSVTLCPPKPLGGIQPNLLHIFPFVRLASVHLSVTLSPPKPLGGILPNLLHHFPFLILMVSTVNRMSLLLNHWAEFNQTCYITSPVCESNIISRCVHRPSICPSRYPLLNHWAEFNQTCYITSPNDKGMREQHSFPFVRLASVHLSVTLSPPKPLGGI